MAEAQNLRNLPWVVPQTRLAGATQIFIMQGFPPLIVGLKILDFHLEGFKFQVHIFALKKLLGLVLSFTPVE